jgi:hypothetical protein
MTNKTVAIFNHMNGSQITRIIIDKNHLCLSVLSVRNK